MWLLSIASCAFLPAAGTGRSFHEHSQTQHYERYFLWTTLTFLSWAHSVVICICLIILGEHLWQRPIYGRPEPALCVPVTLVAITILPGGRGISNDKRSISLALEVCEGISRVQTLYWRVRKNCIDASYLWNVDLECYSREKGVNLA